MILYTPLSETDIFPYEVTKDCMCIQHGGKTVYAKKLENGSFEVQQLLSTDPQDFLNASYAPGMIFQSTE